MKAKKMKNNYFPLQLERGMVFTFLGNRHPPGSIDIPGVNRDARRRQAKMIKLGKKKKININKIFKTPILKTKPMTGPAQNKKSWLGNKIKSIANFFKNRGKQKT